MTVVPPPPISDPRDPAAKLPRLDRHRPKGTVRTSKVTRWRIAVLIGVHVLIALHFLHWWWTGRSVTPVEPSEAMQTLELGKINAGFLLFAALILVTLLAGRWFCGWACHVVALQDLCAGLLGKLGFKPKPVRSRLLVLVPWVVAFHMFAWPRVQHWLFPAERHMPGFEQWHLELTTTDLWQTFPGPLMAVLTFVVVGGLIVWWLGAKGFCTYGCPYGALFATADRFAPIRIKVSDACDGCGHCTHVCTSNVRVHEEVAKHGQIVDPGCMKCLDCVSVCPKDALSVGFAMPKPFAVSQQRIQQRADFSWWEELLMAAVAFVATQWTFRGTWFAEGVPFLLAVGLGVITATVLIALLRLLRRPEFAFQHMVWKQHGYYTRRGRIALVVLTGWLLFTAHTFVAQRMKDSALETAAPPLAAQIARRNVPAADLTRAFQAVDSALAVDLIDDPLLLKMRGLLGRELGRHDEAEADLRAAWEAVPRLDRVGAALALYRIRAGDLADAERIAHEVLKWHPNDPTATTLLKQIEQARQQRQR